MLKNFIFIFFLLYNTINSNNNQLNLLSNYNGFINDGDLYSIFYNIIYYIMGTYDTFLKDLNISEQCNSQLLESFFKDKLSISAKSFPFYKKLFFHSSQKANDLSSYNDCINNKVESFMGYKSNLNFTFLTILIDDNKSLYDILTTNRGFSSYLLGICFIDKCSINDYELIFRKGMEFYNLSKYNNNNNNLNDENNKNFNNTKIKIYLMNDNNNKSNGFIKFLVYLPFIIICIHLLFVTFNAIPIYFYKLILCIFYCKYNQKSSSTRNSKLKNNLIKSKRKKSKHGSKHSKSLENEKKESSNSFTSNDDNIIKSLDLLYNIKNNFTALTELKKQNEITNDGGLSYVNGIKGMAMIFFLFGSVYSALYSSLVTDQNREEFYSHLNNLFFSIYYIGIKFAPKLLLSSSGFSLFYKFICFLDGKVDNEREIIRQKEDSIIGGKEIQDIKNNNVDYSNSNSSYQRIKKESKQNLYDSYMIPIKYIFYFFGMQLHKYILYLLFIFFVLFSLDGIVSIFNENGPMWQFFNQSMVNSAKNIKFIIPLLIGYKSYFIPQICPEKKNILHYFYLVSQEIIYFLISTLIIFIGYKKNLRIDRFFKIVFIFLIIFRIIYYFLTNGLDDKDYFGYHEWGQFYSSILYDYTFYIIGIHYGMINYIIQKGYTVKECKLQNKKYLESSLNILSASKKRNKKYLYIIAIISSLLLLLNSFMQQIIIYIIKLIKSKNLDDNMDLYKRDFISQIIMLFDSDIFVISINALGLCMYIKGDNLINNILCHSLWSIFNRFYFSYILLINPIILYILYNSETKIFFTMANCIFYSSICGIFVYFLTMIIYVTFELPFKKFIRFLIKLNEKGVFKERLSNLEATFSYCHNDNLLDSATASITDYNDEDSDDEDDDEY